MQKQNYNNQNNMVIHNNNKFTKNNKSGIINAILWGVGFFAYYFIIVVIVSMIIFLLAGVALGVSGISMEHATIYVDTAIDGILNIIIAISALLLMFSYISYILLYKQYIKGEKTYKKPDIDLLSKHTCLTFLISFFIRFVGVFGAYALITLLQNYINTEDINNLYNAIPNERMNTLVSAISSVLCAPIYEEIVFRYGVQKNLDKIYPKASVLITSIIFAIIHMNISSFIPIFVLSIYIGNVYKKTDNLVYPTLIHMAFNVTAVLAQYTISVLF